MRIKLLFSTTLLMLSLCTVYSQVIPNYSFENWSNGTNHSPDGWSDHGSNHTGFYPVTQATDHYLGTYAIRIENKLDATDTTMGIAYTTRPNGQEGFGPSFPINNRYNNLKGFYKLTSLNGDSAQIIVYLTKTGYVGPWGDLVAWGQGNMGASTTFAPFSVGYLDSLVNFVYNDNIIVPDSGYIALHAFKPIDGSSINLNPLGNSVLIVDALNFDSYLSSPENMDITSNFHLFPSVSNGNLNVKFETSENDFTTIKIYDLNGREIMNLFSGNLNKGNHDYQYNVHELINGNYLFLVASGKGYRAEKFCIQK